MNNNITTIIRIALATIAMAIATSCADHLDHQDPLTPHTPGQLGIATITLNQSATATPATRATLEDGTTVTSTDGMMLINPNTAITTLTDGEQLLATYNFTADAPTGTTYTAVAQRSTGSNPAQWQFIATGANDPVLRPNAENDPTSAETWQDTRLALTLTGTPYVTPAGTIFSPYAGMITCLTEDVTDPEGLAPDGITTRLFYDALRATTDATTKRGTVTIDLTPQSPTLGRLSAAMAHVGALMTLKDADITGTIISGSTGINITADNITAIYAIVKYTPTTGANPSEETFHVPFTHVATGTTPAATPAPNAWQAIVPASAKVQKFIVQAAPAAPSTTVTIPINLPDEKTLNADYRYPLTLALNGSKAQITLTLPAKPGWGTPADEQEITDGTAYLKHIGGTGADANNPLRYEVSHPLGLRLLQQWINSEIDPNNTGKAPKTTIANSDVHSRLATHITLTADMDMTLLPTITTGTYTGSNWKPIGTSSAPYTPYTGTFDGNHRTIKGMKVTAEITSDDTYAYAALFARITGATIKNLTMTDAVVSATATGTRTRAYAAAVAANASTSHIENCKVEATTPGTPISATADNSTGSSNFSYAGSIAGDNNNTTIIACSNTACAATASAAGSDNSNAHAGGIVGRNSGTIIACISTGTATAEATGNGINNIAYSGGIVGRSIDIDTGTTIACYTTQPINNQTGGITANQYGTKVDGGLPAINTTAKIAEINLDIDEWNATGAATTAQQCPYHYQVTGTSGSDAMPTTEPIPAGDMPTPTLNPSPAAGYKETTEGGKTWWLIYNRKGLNAFGKQANSNLALCARLMNNITMTPPADPTAATASNWTPIATSSAHYTGTFDGNHHSIKGMVVKIEPSGGSAYAALFARTNGATIKNLTMIDAVASATATAGENSMAAAVVAEASGSHIENCRVEATTTTSSTVSSSSDESCYAGGIVGWLMSGNIMACSNSGCAVKATGSNYIYAGGIAGNNFGSGNIIACSNTGAITATGSNNAGGIAGGGTTTACWSTGTVTSGTTAGTTTTPGGTYDESAYITMNSAIVSWNGTAIDGTTCPYRFVTVLGDQAAPAGLAPGTIYKPSNP